MSATPVWWPWRHTAQQCLGRTFLGEGSWWTAAICRLFRLTAFVPMPRLTAQACRARPLLPPGTALTGSLCSGALPSVWQRLSQEGHCSPKFPLPSPPSCPSLFPGVRPALWSEGSPCLLLLCLPFILAVKFHLGIYLTEDSTLVHPLGRITGNCLASGPLSDYTPNPAGLHAQSLPTRSDLHLLTSC